MISQKNNCLIQSITYILVLYFPPKFEVIFISPVSPQGGYAAYRYAQPAGTAATAYSDRYVYFLLPPEGHLKVLC